MYPLLIDVEGVEPGLYHYGVERHELALLEPLERDEAAQLAVAFTCGQTYFGDAARSFCSRRASTAATGSTVLSSEHTPF